MIQTKEDYYQAIDAASYSGEKQLFTYRYYVTTHADVHQVIIY